MCPDRETFLDICPTPMTLLRCEAYRHSDHHVTSSLSLVHEGVEKRAPTRVVKALGQVVMAHHPCHVQVFHADAAVALCVLFGRLEVEVAALPDNFEVLLGHLAFGFLAAMALLLAAVTKTLRAAQALWAGCASPKASCGGV